MGELKEGKGKEWERKNRMKDNFFSNKKIIVLSVVLTQC